MIITPSIDDQLMVMAMHRYCLGRASYIVGSCIASLKQVWPMLVSNTRSVILDDTRRALARDEAGMAMDHRAWQYFIEWAEREITTH